MEGLLYVVGFFGAIFVIGWLFSTISDAFKKYREKIRDQVAEEVLNGINLDEVIENYKGKLAHIKRTKIDFMPGGIDMMIRLLGRDYVLLNKCPKCKEGDLRIVHKGQSDKFIACTKYPKCDYKISIEEARATYKISINEEIIDNMHQAYSHL